MPEDDAAGPARRRMRRSTRRARTDPQVRVSLLGAFALTVDGAARELPRGARRLVALLGLHPRGLSRIAAAERLAPHLEAASAGATLRKTLTRVRATRLPLIRANGEMLRLHPGVAIDLWEAEALAARLADHGQLLPEYGRHEVLTLVLLPGWEDDWAERARTTTQGRFLCALEVYARRLHSRGDRYQALTVCQQAWESDPLHESTVAALVGIHLASGDRGQALGAYDIFERQLAATYELEPTERLRKLVAPLLAGRPRP